MSRIARYLTILVAVLAVALPCLATTHFVAVGNFFFNPADLTVNQGDTVVWTNGAGTHNVHHNATPSLFGNTAAIAPWTYQFVFDLPPDTYHYICQIHPTLMQGTVTVQGTQAAPEPPAVVNTVELDQNYPNPFNSETAIRFSLPNATNVKLTIMNVLGEPVTEIFNGPMNSGAHQFLFDASKLSSGLYYYRLETPLATLARKMYLIK
jgi:plastocyanin